MFCGLVFRTCWDLKDALNLPKNHSKKLISLASVARYFNLELIKSFIRSWFFNFVTLVLTSKIEFIDTLVRLWYLTVNNGGLKAGIFTLFQESGYSSNVLPSSRSKGYSYTQSSARHHYCQWAVLSSRRIHSVVIHFCTFVGADYLSAPDIRIRVDA